MGSGARTEALVIVLNSDVNSVIVSGCAPVEQVVEPNFYHLNIAVEVVEGIVGEERGRGRNEQSPVSQPEIVVFELHRPIVRERIFDANACQPAVGVVAAVGEGGEGTAGERHARRKVGDGQVVVADPACATLTVHQPAIDGEAEAGSHCRDPAIVAGDRSESNARNGDRDVVVIVGAPVAVPFAADDELADLVIDADLPAADEYASVIVEVRVEKRFGPLIVGPGTANVSADVESGPTEHGWRWRWRRGLDR